MSNSLELAMLLYCDLCAVARGRSMPAAKLNADPKATVGWVPSAVARPPIGPSVKPNPFGPLGDLRLLPDPTTRTTIPGDERSEALDFVLCDLVDPAGQPWDCCPRTFLRDCLLSLRDELDARLIASFEHEFQLSIDDPPPPAMSIEAMRVVEPFPSRAMCALADAGLTPEAFVPESAPHQYEIPVAPAEGVASADHAVMLREIVREVSRRCGMPASFSPASASDQYGNGVHIHLSLIGMDGTALFSDIERPAGLSRLGGSFAAGILSHAPALIALTAPSPISSARLRPGQRGASVIALGGRNRETLLRLPPAITIDGVDVAPQIRLEYRAADATANPYLALGALIRAGLSGVRHELPTPAILDLDPATLTHEERTSYHIAELPSTLVAALDALDANDTRTWMSRALYRAYVAVKRAEASAALGLSFDELCSRYAAVY